MAINWRRFAAEVRRLREEREMTQDVLAAKVGVTWNTIARLETGRRRPSLDLLERLANVLQCRISDLIPEKEKGTDSESEPILQGTTSNFRSAAARASSREWTWFRLEVAPRPSVAFRYQYDYWHAGRILAHMLCDLIPDGDLPTLERFSETKDIKKFYNALLDFLDRKFPGCMALIPKDRRAEFMRGFLRAIAGYNDAFDLAFPFNDMSHSEREAIEKFYLLGPTQHRTIRERFPGAFLRAVSKYLEWQTKSGKGSKWILHGTPDDKAPVGGIGVGGDVLTLGEVRAKLGVPRKK